jgi:hypothetical protein
MRRDDLVCANCSGPVSEGRCPVCRVTRNGYGRSSDWFRTPLWVLLALLALVVCTIALENRFA